MMAITKCAVCGSRNDPTVVMLDEYNYVTLCAEHMNIPWIKVLAAIVKRNEELENTIAKLVETDNCRCGYCIFCIARQ